MLASNAGELTALTEPAPREVAVLQQLYDEIHVVNRDVSRRLGAATRTDPARNAVALLDTHAALLPVALDKLLEESHRYLTLGK